MNNIGRVKQVIANLIVKKAVGTAENTVGRSFPQGLHEIEVPNEVKNYLAKKQK